MICTPAEVAAHAGHESLTAEETAALTTQIALYQGELEGLLGRAVEKATRTETVAWTGQRWYAAHGPVHAVSAVSVAGVPLTTSQYAANRNGIEVNGWYYAGAMTVEYVGGWDAPRNLPAKSAVMARAARWLNKRTDDDVGTETSAVEGHSVKWMPDAFTEQEMAACASLRAPDMAG